MARARRARGWMVAVGLVAGLAAGCGGARRKADAAMERGDYMAAATFYDEALAKDPDDRELLAQRDQARQAALGAMLVETEAAWHAARPAAGIVELGQLLDQRDHWRVAIDPALVQRLSRVVGLAAQAIADGVTERVQAGGPLTAEAFEHTHRLLLSHADFGARGRQVRAIVQAAGERACSALAPSATTPYWTWLVDRYCRHWGSSPVTVPPLPHWIGELTVTGSIQGESDEESARLRGALAAAFRASPWFGPTGASAAPAQGAITGELAASFESQPTTLSADWTESVPYTAYESVAVDYQEPYSDTESYSEQVPSTEYRSVSVPCGSTTCTESHPETVYHTEWKTRTVTKYRTATRYETQPVTRYRDEPRTYTYSAIEQSGHYTSRLSVDIAPIGALAVVTADFTDEGYDHDASFSAAGVSPSRANLLSLAGLAVREQDRLAAELALQLDARYADRFCNAPSYTAETAAACAYRDPGRIPEGARAALHETFGADVAFLPGALRP